MSSKKKGSKKPGKLGLTMRSVGSSALKGMSRAGKSMQKGAVKAKQKAHQKIGKVPISEEEPEILAASARLKIIKNDIYTISDLARNLYESRVHEATYLSHLSDKLQQIQASQQNDAFASVAQQIGAALSSLEQVNTKYLKRLEDSFVKPLEKFRNSDIEYSQKLKLKAKDTKTEYDIAVHKLNKAQKGDDLMKIDDAQKKQETIRLQLAEVRDDMKSSVIRLEKKKQTYLVESLQNYWTAFQAFSAARSNIMNQNDVDVDVKGNYIPTSSGQTGENMSNNNNNNYNDNNGTNEAVMQSMAHNPEVQNAGRSAMQDKNIRNAAFTAYKGGGNDVNSNAQLAGALAKNKQVQSAGISVAKDKNVQKAAWKGAKSGAKLTANKAKHSNYKNPWE